MKLEFIKETNADGSVIYFTNRNGYYINKSLSLDYDKAKSIYDNVVNNKGKYISKEILESVEIEVEVAQSEA